MLETLTWRNVTSGERKDGRSTKTLSSPPRIMKLLEISEEGQTGQEINTDGRSTKTLSSPPRIMKLLEISEEGQTGQEINTDKRQKKVASKTQSEPPRLTISNKSETEHGPARDQINKGEKMSHLFYESRQFQHFQYAMNLVRDCSTRLESVPKEEFVDDFTIKINYAGAVTKENLRLVTKRKGKTEICRDPPVWESSPLLCFQNDLSLKAALELLLAEEACHKILVTSNLISYGVIDVQNEKIIIADNDNVQEGILSCLEEPLRRCLRRWARETPPTRTNNRIISEIKSIQKQMSFEEPEEVLQSDSMRLSNTNIVPSNIKKHLFREDNVTSFGLWQYSVFRVFVKPGTDGQKLYNELQDMDKHFFKQYTLEIENKKIVESLAMKQGDCILPSQPTGGETIVLGTLGGFVTKPSGSEEKYALTCSHLFPEENLSAYGGLPPDHREIGKCVFTTREKFCDFAVIKIKDSELENSDITFRRDDDKETNAHMFEGKLDSLGILHKIGTGSGLTKGTLISEEFYVKQLFNDDKPDSLFLVSGTGNSFSQDGDSGSLVFSRPRQVKQNYVNVVGMVFGSNVIVDGNDENLINPEESERISSCFRITTALNLLKNEKRILVKFKDDLFSSSSDDSS